MKSDFLVLASFEISLAGIVKEYSKSASQLSLMQTSN
jgi:hypothetical protein